MDRRLARQLNMTDYRVHKSYVIYIDQKAFLVSFMFTAMINIHN